VIDPKNTQQAIDKLLATPQCLQSLRDVKCYDYEARFGAFIRVKCGIILLSAIDWDKVAQAMEAAI
jgi:hypothetical protein